MKIYQLILIIIVLIACNDKPQPIRYGFDPCHECKMIISDKLFGAELITTKGKTYKFDDLICMVKYMKSGAVSQNEIAKKLVINYQKENNFLEAGQAFYYAGEDVHSPMNGNVAAFLTKQDAQNFKNGKQGAFMEWQEVFGLLE
ncbi:MAG: nitrous oxide reductase accessory protein NosL [Bacteroidia bacterium]|nr:nitrous oxide reductase accessory protein NosL [Bacteroidia bacterium]